MKCGPGWFRWAGEGLAGIATTSLTMGRQPSASRIVPELQHVKVGDLFPALRGVREGFTVLRVDPEQLLVLGWVPPTQRRPVLTWAYVLKEPKPETTRLIVRARAGDGFCPSVGFPDRTITDFTAWGHFLMQQKQLIGIAQRAESRR